MHRPPATKPPFAVLFGACPQCGTGDLAIKTEQGDVRASCLQCGYRGQPHSVYPLKPACGARAAPPPRDRVQPIART